ncbi:MAG: hypothetical protein OXG35_18330 [Acidobacteria bacterium]|nr:hypothetical protein [Acidobacteriota bacterium]
MQLGDETAAGLALGAPGIGIPFYSDAHTPYAIGRTWVEAGPGAAAGSRHARQ